MEKDEILNLLYTGDKSNIDKAFKEAKLIDLDLADYFGLDKWSEFKISKYKLFGSTDINLSKGLKDAKPLLPFIKKLKHLKKLILFDKQIMEIPLGTFDEMPNLEFLQIGGWRENDYIPIIQPEAFKGLNNLKTLHLFRNKTEKLSPHSFKGLDNLKELNVGQNNIEQLEKETFYGLEKLSELNLSHNKIQELKPGCFAGLSNLKEMTLFNNPIEFLPEHMFKDLNNLEVLNLGNCLNLRSFDIAFLSHTPNLKDIRIWDTGLSQEQVSTIEAAIA